MRIPVAASSVRQTNEYFSQGVSTAWSESDEIEKGIERFISPAQLVEELASVGLCTVGPALDNNTSWSSVTLIAQPEIGRNRTDVVSILASDPQGRLATALRTAMIAHNLTVDIISPCDLPAEGVPVISILDLEDSKPFLEGIAPGRFGQLQRFLAHGNLAGLLWLTKSCQMDCVEPQYAVIIGLARVLRNELGINISTFELDEYESEGATDAICRVHQKLQQIHRDEEVDVDNEYCLFHGDIHIPRFHWMSIVSQLAGESRDTSLERLEIGTRGSLRSLHWTKHQGSPLNNDEVLIETRASGLNFKVCP